MIPLYRAGTSPLHRAPAWTKLLALIVIAALVAGSGRDPRTTAILGAVTVAAYAVAGFGPAVLMRQLWMARWLIVFVAVAQLPFLPWTDALIGCARIALLVAVAALVTLTTRTTDMMGTITTALGPLRHAGVAPERIALTLSLAIGAVPVVSGFVRTVREARAARGGGFGLRAWIVPVLVLTLKYADDLADALTARGVE